MKLDNATKRLLRDPDKRRAWIKYQFQLRNRTLADVAREAGVTRQCIYHVFNITYPRMEKVVADALGLEPKVLFPDRYDQKTGLPHYRYGRPRGSGSKKSLSQHNTSTARRNTKSAR